MGDQKLVITNYFLMSSPPGQIDEVLADVGRIVDNDGLLTNDKINEMLSRYHTEMLSQCGDGEGKKMVLGKVNQVTTNTYVHPSTQKVMTVDLRSRTATPTGDSQQLDDKVAAYRTAIEKSMQDYLGRQYIGEKAVCSVYAKDDGIITILLSGLNKNLSNFWSGGWRGEFSVDVSAQGTAPLAAKVKITIHYFEEGNVQLNASRQKSVDVQITDPTTTADGIAKAIEKWENEYQSNIEEMYVEIHSTTFKQMRRFLPITQEPMNWNTMSHSLAAEIGGQK